MKTESGSSLTSTDASERLTSHDHTLSFGRSFVDARPPYPLRHQKQRQSWVMPIAPKLCIALSVTSPAISVANTLIIEPAMSAQRRRPLTQSLATRNGAVTRHDVDPCMASIRLASASRSRRTRSSSSRGVAAGRPLLASGSSAPGCVAASRAGDRSDCCDGPNDPSASSLRYQCPFAAYRSSFSARFAVQL